MNKKGLSFNDIALVPAPFCEISSRKDVDPSPNISSIPALRLPIISSNMDTVYSPELAKAIAMAGGVASVHRFWSINENVEAFKAGWVETDRGLVKPVVSIGIGDAEFERCSALVEAGAEVVLIDLANGACQGAVEQFNKVSSSFPEVKVWVGNFATKEQLTAFIQKCTVAYPEVIKVGIGQGCGVEGTRVLMGDGSYKNIEDIKVHDEVINKEGKPVKVTSVKYSGEKEVVSFKSNLFYKETRFTEDHLFWVGDTSTSKSVRSINIGKFLDKSTRNGRSKISWKPIGFCENDRLLMPKKINFQLPDYFSLSLEKFYESRRGFNEGLIETESIQPNYDLGYVFGTFLGDGCASIYKTNNCSGGGRRNTSCTTTWYFGKNELNIAEKLDTALRVAFPGVNPKIKLKTNNIEVVLRNNFLTKLFKEFGKKTNKHLPKQYICQNKEYLNGLYDGLIDSDGSILKDGRDQFANTSTQLTEQFMLFHYLLKGYYPSIQKMDASVGTLRGANVSNFNSEYKARSCKSVVPQTSEFQVSKLYNFKRNNEVVKTYDIEVDCSTHSFIANNSIVHNSACTTRTTTGVGLPSIASIESLRDVCKELGIKILFDGGINTPGDLAKAIALGCDAVMMGRHFAATYESAAPKIYLDEMYGKERTEEQYVSFLQNLWKTSNKTELESKIKHHLQTTKPIKAVYRGSASIQSYKVQGKDAAWRAPEGEQMTVTLNGSVQDVIQKLEGGLRSAMTYCNCLTLTDFKKYGRLHQNYIEVSTNSYIESQAHGKFGGEI